MPTPREPLIEERLAADGVAVVAMRNGRLNTLIRPLRTELIETFDRLEADPRVRVIVLCGAEGMFSAGADLTEFDSGQGLAEPSLHDTILTFLDEMRTPVVALIEGIALGGGLELAMGCHYRLARPDALVGLPEITFGFLPGAGGTQRLPRAVGLERGLSMVLTGVRVRASELASTPLITGLVEGEDALVEATGFAREIAGLPNPRLRDISLRTPDAAALLALVARSQGTHAPGAAAVAAIAAGMDDVDRGFAREHALFRELAQTAEASARRHLFLSERAAKRRPAGVSAGGPLVRIGVIGGGTMGRGIALAHALAGMSVQLVEIDAARLQAAQDGLEADARRALRSRPPAEFTALTARITYSTDLAELSGTDMVIEAVPEVMDLKLEVFRRLDRAVGSRVILATNTSSLDVDVIAAAVSHPERVVGTHFFSPAHVMKLLEIVKGAHTSEATLARVLSHASSLGKVPVISAVAPGFIGNRILEASSREVGLMLLEGATPSQIDGALERWGMRMGPLRVLDLVGNDVPMLTRESAGTAADIEWRPTAELVAQGRLGIKTGAGWYRYEGSTALAAPEVEHMIAQLSKDAGIVRRELTDREIVERAVLAMVNEGAAVLEEGVAQRAGDIDVVFTSGYGYPKERGGPMRTADTLGLRNVVRIMSRFAAREGGSRWTPRSLIVECAQSDAALAEWGADR